MKSFTKKNLDGLGREINAALAKIGKKHGIAISKGNGSFSATEYNTKITAVIASDSSELSMDPKVLKSKAYLEENYSWLGVEKSKVGAWFRKGNQKLQLVGYNRQAPKYPLVLLNERNEPSRATKTFIEWGVTWL